MPGTKRGKQDDFCNHNLLSPYGRRRVKTFYILTPIGLKNPGKIKKAEREITKKNFKALFSTSKKEYDEKHQELIDKGYTWYAR